MPLRDRCLVRRCFEAACATFLLAVLPGNAGAATRYWCGDGSANAWDMTTSNWTNGDPRPGFVGNTTYADGDDVIFIRDMAANRRTIVVQPAGVQPKTLRIDTSGTWNFSGGIISNTPLTYYDSSGGGSTLHFNQYTQSMPFTVVSNFGYGGVISYNLGGPPGIYHFGTGPIVFDHGFAAGFKFNPTNGAGAYVLTNDFAFKNTGGNNLSVGGGANKVHVFSGDFDVFQDCNILSDAGVNGPWFSGAFTLYASRQIHNDTSPGGGDGIVHFTDASLLGPTYHLRLKTSNANARRFLLPDSGTRLDVASLTVESASVYVSPTNAAEDYFAAVRSHGVGVVVTGFPSLGNYLYLQRGSYTNSDFVTTNSGRLVIDQRTSNEWVNLQGRFCVGGAGNGLTTLWWLLDQDSTANGRGIVTGLLEVAEGGRVILHASSDQVHTYRLDGDLRLAGGSTLERITNGVPRTVRVQLPSTSTLTLGDGDPGTRETITLVGEDFNSGGPEEAWGFSTDTVSDDGNVVLRYAGPNGPGPGNSYHYAVDWRNAAGTVQAFRAGSGGTEFAPGTLTDNDGFVCRGPTTGHVFTTTAPAAVTSSGLVTFAVNLANNNVAHQRGTVLADGTNAAFEIRSNGTVRALLVTATNGARVGGTGTFQAGLDVAGNSVLAAGWNGVGALTVASNMNFQSHARCHVGYDETTSGLVRVTGTLTLGTNALVTITRFGGPTTLPEPVVLFQAGALAGATELRQWQAVGQNGKFKIEGNDVMFIPVPAGTLFVIK